jgi:hypothetical protein
MEHTMRIAVLALAAAMACADSNVPTDVDVPAGLTPVELTTAFRNDFTWTDPPMVTFVRLGGGIRFHVARMTMCAMVASAGTVEVPGVITVYATVNHHPAAMCIAGIHGTSTYEGILPADTRSYRVNVYERAGDGAAQLIGTAVVPAP